MRDGLPFHKFWAGMAQMFLDNATVSVTPKIITQFLTAVVVLIIIIILIKAGSAYALAVFVCTCISYFFFNNFSMRYFGFYLPIFDVLYTAFLATLLSAFLGISYNLYRQSVLTAEQEGMAENIDLKSNFLSLVTHNLNTPIAKLKGLFDVITMQGFYNRFRNQVDLCRQKVALMQIAVKSVLLSTALEQNNLYAKNHTLAQLSEEFIDLAKPIYEPFGLEVNVEYAVEDLSPVQIDPKFFIHAILVLILTHAKSQQNIRVYLSVGEGGVNGSIAMKNLNGISPLSSFVKEMSQKYLNDFKSITGIKVTENLFMDQVQIQLFVP